MVYINKAQSRTRQLTKSIIENQKFSISQINNSKYIYILD